MSGRIIVKGLIEKLDLENMNRQVHLVLSDGEETAELPITDTALTTLVHSFGKLFGAAENPENYGMADEPIRDRGDPAPRSIPKTAEEGDSIEQIFGPEVSDDLSIPQNLLVDDNDFDLGDDEWDEIAELEPEEEDNG